MTENLFDSFWMGGYECSDQLNCFGHRADLLHTSGHLQLLDEDYKSLAQFKIKTVREGIQWSKVEKRPYEYDWSTVVYMFEKAKANNIQQIWDICHFGYPDDLSPLHPMFPWRFAAICRAFALLYKEHFPHSTLVVTPINEVSFISWLGGDVKGTTPYCHGQGWEVKYNLMKAYIQGAIAMKEVDPGIKILTTEPLINITTTVKAKAETLKLAAMYNDNQFQSTDILCGKSCPELGGSPELMDIIGFNYYFNNQWRVEDHTFLGWKEGWSNAGWASLASLLAKGFNRYECPIILSETSHGGIDRPQWINYVGKECVDVLQKGIPLLGVCLYPIVDRTDWDHPDHWHHAGLWDAELKKGSAPTRVLYKPYADALLKVQRQIEVLSQQEQLIVSQANV